MSPVKMPSRSEYTCLAKVAEEAGRHKDVVDQLKNMIYVYNARLNVEERSMLSVAYKNITNDLRNSWRIIDQLETLEVARGRPRPMALIKLEKSTIEGELVEACKEIVKILGDRLIPCASVGEETVFYAKMQGDYYRYIFQFVPEKQKDHYSELSLNSYKFAYKHALGELDPVHPTRLGLALNFSVYYHDVLNSPERACHLAKHAFDEAVQCLDDSPSKADAVMILQLLRDDLLLWVSEIQGVPAKR
ncbi:14-3-3 protein [Athelia psychrophila]|uniref:14-3-3 protein n=1 Tax=Athelia psychrophila TaxID=1759441 RepID=A0A166VNW5_9AGAM|nr:14-3-3 protein [Fibularhizoctonia sp. CBS 109695]